ncbi:hypothetical protein GCM10010145_25900 [Streptomyces ruber]|uniref:Secreted protein n=2 Tax=Streptomyces TaxID=1883 RepID=A0A918BDX0_9ACTN|nr:hypothetical protein [Streptomyces ruber]GGQ55056.1 hypothetical protein GCM10010145_25900 [Streptomyces ruber]
MSCGPRGVRGALRRSAALAAALLTAAGLLLIADPADAQAAAGPCAGRVVRTLPFSTGTVHVHKRRGYVCAIAVAGKQGVRQWMSVSVRARGGRPVVDRGRFRYHAGPVTVHAGGRCVWVEGVVGKGSVRSGWTLC